MHPDSKLFGLGGQRSNLPLMDGQGHPMLGSPQPGVGISHHNSLPMMHPSMKSPLTPQGGPLELTVNSHQRNSMGGDTRKFSLGTPDNILKQISFFILLHLKQQECMEQLSIVVN